MSENRGIQIGIYIIIMFGIFTTELLAAEGSVYVGNLRKGVKTVELESEFAKYGKVKSVFVSFRPHGFAFVDFEDLHDAERACDNLNGKEVLGSKLLVEIQKNKT